MFSEAGQPTNIPPHSKVVAPEAPPVDHQADDTPLTQRGADRDGPVGGSFRDPSGVVFRDDGTLYRSVAQNYKDDYELLLSSGLYSELTSRGLLVEHQEVTSLQRFSRHDTTDWYKVLQPKEIPFISYPYEWCFSQLKDAALATLDIHSAALARGMSLKDASAFNIQYVGTRPIFIDTLSFERYQEGQPWVAYRQFCEHFLAPLLLISRCDVRLAQLSLAYPGGVPLDLASRLLPRSSWFRPGVLMHIHLHAATQRRYAAAAAGDGTKVAKGAQARVSKTAMLGLIDSLRSLVAGITWEPGGTEWAEYYQNTNYSLDAMSDKERLVSEFIQTIRPRLCWDLGGNDGTFSRLSAATGAYTVCADIDPSAVEKNYRASRQASATSLLPLVMDLTNPSPALGWSHQERSSLIERGPADLVIALALIHHLAISNNVPLARLAKFFADAGSALLIEFVPKHDSQVQRLLASREDVFPSYTQERFEVEFSRFFIIERKQSVGDSVRTLYCMRRRR